MSAIPIPSGFPLGRPIVDEAFLADPYPTYAALRKAGPLLWSEEFHDGAWLLTRHCDVEAVLRDEARFSARRTGAWVMGCEDGAGTELQDFQRLFARALPFLDPPDHRRLRAAMSAGFDSEALQQLRAPIEHWIEGRLDALGESPDFDFMVEFARPLPAQVIAILMGIPDPDRDEFFSWSEALAAFIGAPRPSPALALNAQASIREMARYFTSLVELRRRSPGEDLVSRLIQAQSSGLVQGDAELLSQCAMLLFAGHETTRNLLGNGLHALLTHPGHWQQLRADPALLPGAIRELLRFDSPVQYTGRRVRAEFVLHGQRLRRDELVLAFLGAANRDPDRFERPDALDFHRSDTSALSFGTGPHVCIGAALARMEARLLFSRILQHWPELRLDEPGARWNGNPVYRGLTALPVATSLASRRI